MEEQLVRRESNWPAVIAAILVLAGAVTLVIAVTMGKHSEAIPSYEELLLQE